MKKNRRLIIEIPYGGFGDHLFHSHLPRIAKETGAFEEVFISSKSLIRQQDHLDIIWNLNPFVDGFLEETGVTCDLKECVLASKERTQSNILDYVMYAFNLDDGKKWHNPEIFYQPKYIEEYNLSIYDPNHFTYVGDFNTHDLYNFLKSSAIHFDAIMKLRGNKALYKFNSKHLIIDAPTVYDFCDVLYSAKEIYCFTSGTATLSAALNKKATVFYGAGIDRGFHHCTLHNYKLVPHSLQTRLRRFVKPLFGLR